MSDSILAAAQLRVGEEARVRRGHEAHAVQLYSEDASLLDVLCRFVGGAVAAGDAALVIATKAHHQGLAARLSERGVDAANAIREGRYVLASAEDTLQKILLRGHVDEQRFCETITDLLNRARNAAARPSSPVAVFGELVALLWTQGKAQDALRLEQWWNDLAELHSFSLLCAYPVSGFNNDRHVGPFLEMCQLHSAIVPSEGSLNLNGAEERLRTIADLQQKTNALEHALQIRHSEERFRQLVEAVQDYAIFMLDPGGYVVSWNIGAQRIKGYQAAEIIGKHFSCFYPAEDLKNRKPETELRLAVKHGRFEDEGWRLRKDGSRFWANVVITAVYDDSGKLMGFGKVTRDTTERMHVQEALRREIRERKEAERKLSESEKALRQLSRHLLRTQDEERRRIGQELHDSLGQSLAAVKMTLDSLSTAAVSDRGVAGKISECGQLADNAIKEVRTLSYLLYPPMLEEMGLKSAILWYLDGFSLRSGIQTTFDIGTGVDRVDRDIELALFRVLQESLTNIHRHSGSRTAQIRLTSNNDQTVLEISDRGKGLASELMEQSTPDWIGASGVGLRGMNERMLQLGGKLEVTSTPQGTTVRAIVLTQETPA